MDQTAYCFTCSPPTSHSQQHLQCPDTRLLHPGSLSVELGPSIIIKNQPAWQTLKRKYRCSIFNLFIFHCWPARLAGWQSAPNVLIVFPFKPSLKCWLWKMEIHLLDFIMKLSLIWQTRETEQYSQFVVEWQCSLSVVRNCGTVSVMMNIRFLSVCLPDSFPSNFSVIASISLNSICREIPSELVWSGLPGFPPRVSHLFYLVWGDNFVTGDFQICRHSPAAAGTARWWVSYYRTLRDNCQQIGGTKNINYLIKTISPAEKRLNSQLVFLAMINSNCTNSLWSILDLTAFLDLFR